MASSSMKTRPFMRCAAVESCLMLLLILLSGRETICGPASCGSALDGGSGNSGITIECGSNSACLNDAVCQCDVTYFSPSGNNTDCQPSTEPDSRCSNFDSDCVFCGSSFTGPCQGCVDVIYNDQCLNQCPDNTRLEVERNVETNLIVKNCLGSGSSALPEWAIIVITVMGAVVLVIIAILIAALACAFLRRSSAGQLDIAERNAKSNAEQHTDVHNIHGTIDDVETKEGGGIMEDYFEADVGKLSNEETEEFFSKLAILRTQAETFLKMLNDMRRRLKELPPSSPATQQYKDVMRDLTRLLYILNKKQEAVRIPPDGIPLLDWSEQILNRYLTAQGKATVNIRTNSVSNAVNNPNRISVIGDQATTHF